MELVEQLIRTSIPWAIAAIALAALFVALRSRRWPSVKGTISVSLTEVESNWKVRSGNRLERSIEERHYLAYSYEVEGQPYLGSRVRPLLNGVSQITSNVSDKPLWSTARSLEDTFREEAAVEVLYCPLYPLWSCLRPGGFGEAVFFGIIAVVLFVAL